MNFYNILNEDGIEVRNMQNFILSSLDEAKRAEEKVTKAIVITNKCQDCATILPYLSGRNISTNHSVLINSVFKFTWIVKLTELQHNLI